MSALVSIVLPVYNGEKYLRESIESVIAQTYTNWELIIVDDCSIDLTLEIANEFTKRDKRIKYYKNETNLRLPRNLNKGFSLSHGDYLTWTSDDNIFYPTAIEKMISTLKEHPDVDFVFCNYEIIDENGNVKDKICIPSDFEDQIVGTNVVGACFMYTRNVYNKIGDYQHGLLLVEDYDYWQRVFAEFKVLPIRECQYQYRIHVASLTGTTNTAVTNQAYQKSISCNKNLYHKFGLGKRYYYYSGMRRCAISQGNSDYIVRTLIYKLLYYYPRKIVLKVKEIKCH